MTCLSRLGTLGMAVVLLSSLNMAAPAQRLRTAENDFLLRLFGRTEARHRSARRNLEAILRAQPEFWQEIHAVAARLGTEPAWLLNIMAFESLFNPRARNPLPGQTASGLLQIIEGTARRLGTTTEEIRRMSPLAQLRLVERYLEPFKGRLKSLPDVYMAVFRGSVVEGGGEVVVVDSSKELRIYKLNRSLDLNNDRRITKGELDLAALSVGRFLPVIESRHGGAGVNAVVHGKGDSRRAPVGSANATGSVAADRPDKSLRPTRSIYIRRPKALEGAGARP